MRSRSTFSSSSLVRNSLFKRRPGKTKRSQRALRKFESKIFENPKHVLLLKGSSTSEVVNDAMNDLSQILKPYTKKLTKRNAFHAFDGISHVEFLGFKNDCSLFMMGSDSKKRPHNIVLGRMFEFKALDLIELGVLAMDPLTLENIKGSFTAGGTIGSKPFIVFEGSEFETESFFIRLRNFLLDFFKGSTSDRAEIDLDGVDRCIMVSLRSENCSDSVVPPSDDCLRLSKSQEVKGNTVLCLRHYAVKKKSGVSVSSSLTDPDQVELIDIGPNFDFELRRVYFAPPNEFKKACALPKEALAKLKASMHDNVSSDSLGNLRGQLHVGKQDINKLNLRRFSSYKRGRSDDTRGGVGVEVGLEDNGAVGVGRDDGSTVGVEKGQFRQRNLDYNGVSEFNESSDNFNGTENGKHRRKRHRPHKDGLVEEVNPETDI